MHKTFRRFALPLLLIALGWTQLVAAAPGSDPALRQKLVRTIQSSGGAQQELLKELARTGSKLVESVLTAWARGEVYVYVAPDGAKVPVMLEDQLDASGKARAIRVDNGEPVKDAQGHDLRYDDSTLDTADADMRLRSTISRTLDLLALSRWCGSSACRRRAVST